MQALERVAEGGELGVSRVVEMLLAFQLEIGGIIENDRSLTELFKRFHRTSKV